ncbi:GspH/FimT family pseudopilin [Aeromonas dhakensis]|uniref:GspH/FimT family pseudopilin n=1 Tax=Aeromonas dhakensis TaxID=196024 RepID=UPI002156F9C6|nr:GspH/FimT family pseudopilin [Aeromonas dhakensis]MCR6740636.1 GspH/FimT family pseudopilin [Aeromonas dhakensis]
MQKGFTLLELMVTTSLVIILMMVGLPSLNSLLQENRAKYESQQLQKYLRQARNQAISDQLEITACLVDTNSMCVQSDAIRFIAFSDDNANDRRDVGEELYLTSKDFRAETVITSNRDAIVFAQDGTSLGNNISFTVCQTGELQRLITLAQSGRASLSEGVTTCP